MWVEQLRDSIAQAKTEHYEIAKSINIDLVLFGNALMTKNNDISSVQDFVASAIESISDESFKNTLIDLLDEIFESDNDENRLKVVAKMQLILVQNSFKKGVKSIDQGLKALEQYYHKIDASKGNQLKHGISRFQIDILEFLPGIEKKAYDNLKAKMHHFPEIIGNRIAFEEAINALYEDINVLIQPSFDEIF